MIDEELLKQVSEITMTDYSLCEDLKDTAEAIIEDLLLIIERLKDEKQSIIDDRDDNFKRFTPEEMLWRRIIC